MPMSETALEKSIEMAKIVTDGLGGRGIFGVEFFITQTILSIFPN